MNKKFSILLFSFPSPGFVLDSEFCRIKDRILAFLLLPQKTPGCFYLFIGLYPILKERLERLPRAVEWVLKIVIFHAMIALCWLVLRIFVPGEAALEFGWLLLATYALALAAFLLYDYALTKLISFYLQKLQKRIGLKRKK